MNWNPKVPPLVRLRDTLVERGATLSTRSRATGSTVRGSVRPPAPESAIVQRVAPMCELLYLMMQQDGVCGVDERQVLRGVARTLSDGALSSAQIDELMTQFDALLEEQGPEERMYVVTETLSADRVVAESAYTLAATMMLADDEATTEELSLLNNLAHHLGISKQRAAELVELPEQG